MGNKQTNTYNINNTSADDVYKHIKQINTNSSTSGRSFTSTSTQQTIYSVSRPWSRISRRRWKESTLTLPYECSKTAWPVTQLESYFLPEFPLTASYNENNFHIIEEISQGAFGKVYKVNDTTKGGVYALKVLSKSKIIKENSIQQVKDEVQIQRVCGHHPFIVNCSAHWQSRKKLYIVSDFVAGGELYNLLKAYITLPIELVQLYVAQIALALDFLHNAGIIYRDLKPENILLDIDGNIQLIDFGLSKWLSYGSKTKTICGTLHYMAPEVLAFEPYGHAADWWSLGVIACLMLTNQYPGNDNDGKSFNFTTGNLLPPNDDLNVASKDLLLRLLCVEPSKRLRSLRTLETIAFYKGYDFVNVREKKIKPNDLLKDYFPNGPANIDNNDFDFEYFNEEINI